MSFTIHGLPVSRGIAIGHAHLVSHAALEVARYVVPEKHVAEEVARFESAVVAVHLEMDAIRKHTAVVAPQELEAFVDLHQMILADPLLYDSALLHIRERRCNAEWALVQQMELLVEQFDELDDPYMRERKQDVVQVVERVLKVLLGRPGHIQLRRGKAGEAIIVAHDLSPADMIQFKDQRFAGFVTDVGGATSHTAIVARSLNLPAVVGLHHARALIREDELLIVDGARGVLIVDPDARVLEEYRLRKSELELERSKLNRMKGAPSATLDGVVISLHANIELPQDVAQGKATEAAGVGLFRTEFLFMNRDNLPDEEEQFAAYRAVVEAMKGKPVTIRTLDVGADKALKGEEGTEANPALGLRAIRYCLAEPAMFMTQLRAILRASAFGRVRILVPMLAHAIEIEQTLALIVQARASLRAEDIAFDEAIQIGGMVEIPAAALCIGMFAKRLDFVSIGTNDLIQYTLAIDRTDEAVAHLYDPLHPAVLRLIAMTIEQGTKLGMDVSVCGEMAGDPAMTRLLLGMGLRQFSMHPSQILQVKRELVRSDVSELTLLVKRLLKVDEPERLRDLVARLNTA